MDEKTVSRVTVEPTGDGSHVATSSYKDAPSEQHHFSSGDGTALVQHLGTTLGITPVNLGQPQGQAPAPPKAVPVNLGQNRSRTSMDFAQPAESMRNLVESK